MTDDIDTMRDALRTAKPTSTARTRGMEGAMAAFDTEFSAENEKNAVPVQGSDAERRLTSRKARDGRAEPRRRKMSRLSTLTMAVGATGIAAVLALFVVVKNSDESPFDFGRALEKQSFESVSAPLSASNTPDSRVTLEVAREVALPEADDSSDLKVVPAAHKNLTRAERAAQPPPAAFKNFAAKRAQDSFAALPAPTIGAQAPRTRNYAPTDDAQPAAAPQRTYSLARIAIPAKMPMIKVEVVQPDGSVKTLSQTLVVEEPSETTVLRPTASGTILPPPGYRPEVVPAKYETYTETVVKRKLHDGTPLETREIQKRRIVEPASVMLVPIDPESGLTPIPFDPKVHTISPQEAQMRDRFAGFEPNPVVSSRETPVSTFSIDVDTASYSYLRRALNGGSIPPARAIRAEELINYFPYDYPGSDSADEPFKASVSVVPTPWNADTQLMHIGIKGYVPPATERPRANIVLLIDTSGSMNAQDKLPLLINSFRLLLDTLDEDDTVSIVTYAGSAGTVLEPTAASERSKIEQAFDRLRAGGSTAGAAGLRLAYDKAQESFDAEAVNRVILATDGDFNVGFSSPEAMKEYVEKKRETGVFLSVLGFGQGNYNDALMQALAQNGNGVAAYIDTLSEARKVLAGEAGGALVPIAKDVKIQVEFNPATVSEYRLIGYETRALNREDFNDDKVDAGDINSGHTVTAIYEITPAGSPAETIDPLRYGTEARTVSENASDELAFVKIRHKLPDSDTSTLQTRPVTMDDAVDTLDAVDREARFAIAVAAVGQKLQGLSALSDYAWDDAIALANGAKGEDPFGYRAEFVGLARLAKSLDARQ